MVFLLKIPLSKRFHTFNYHFFYPKFHSARLHTITYLPTEFQACSFNTLDFYKKTDRPTNQPTATRNIEDIVDPKNIRFG